MDRAGRLAAWRAEAAVPVSGWDWSGLATRLHDEPLPWDFEALCAQALNGAAAVLDLGTGGGERLLRLTGLPADTVATEGWPPNVEPARERLAGRGVPVVEHAPPAPLPFDDGRFDLVMSRHMGVTAAEVARVLRPGGVLLTQQVGADDLADLRSLLGQPVSVASGLEAMVDELRAAGCRVEVAQSHHGTMTIDNVGGLVRYLALVPWYAPADFGVDAYAELLLGLRPPLRFRQSRSLLRASRP